MTASRRNFILALPLVGASSAVRAQSQTVPADARFALSISEWGARGGNAEGDAQAIQRAFNEAPVGTDLHFPPGEYRITRPLKLTRQLNLIGNGAYIRADFREGSLLTINVADTMNRDNRNQRIQGLRLSKSVGVGNALHITNSAPNLANIGMLIENNVLAGPSTGLGNALRLEGIGTHHLVIRSNQIENGIYLNTADGVTIEDCLIFGLKSGIVLDIVDGAFQTRIVRNCIVSRDGALVIINGSQVYFEQNTVEQFQLYGVNLSKNRSHIAIMGHSSCSNHIQIVGNNFGGGDNNGPSIHATGRCDGLFIDRNVFNVNASAFDVILDGPDVAWTRIGQNNSVRGPARRRPHLALGDPIAVDDRGTGTFGIRSTAIQAVSPWRATNPLLLYKTFDHVLHLQGRLSGQGSAGSVIARLAAGFRPIRDTIALAIDDRGGTVQLGFDRAGAVRLMATTSGQIALDGISVLATLPPTQSEE